MWHRRRPMKYLVIDTTKQNPFSMVVEDGCKFGTTQLLDWSDLADYALWVGINGGRQMLDQFEVKLINDGVLHIWPVDELGEPLHDECECQEFRRYDDETRIAWLPKCRCERCFGYGSLAPESYELDPEDLCISCDGRGWDWGDEFETDMQGNPLQKELTAQD